MTVILMIIAAAILLGFGWYCLTFGGKTQCRNCGVYMPKRMETCPRCGYQRRENYDDPHMR